MMAITCYGRYACRPSSIRQSENGGEVGSLLFQRTSGDGCEFAGHPIRHVAGDRQLALAFESLNRRVGFRVEYARRLDLCVAKLGECALHRKYALRRPEDISDRIVAYDLRRVPSRTGGLRLAG